MADKFERQFSAKVRTEKLCARRDNAEKIIKVMGDASRETANRLHLLCLAKMGLPISFGR